MKPKPPGSLVLIKDISALRPLLNAKLICEEQLAYARRRDIVKNVMTMESNIFAYQLRNAPGVWPDSSFELGRKIVVSTARPNNATEVSRGRAPNTGFTGLLDTQPSAMRRVFVGSLPWSMSDAALLKLFVPFCSVVEAFISMDKMTGRSKGFGFVTTRTEKEADLAISGLNGATVYPNGDFEHEDKKFAQYSGALLIIEEASKRFAELICREPGRLQELEWRDLERMIAVILENLGYAVKLTCASKDGGKDIVVHFVASQKTHSFYVEIKHWVSGKKVGAGHIKEFISVVVCDELEGGILISTSGFRADATVGLTEIERGVLRYGDKATVVSLCRTYVNTCGGLCHPDVNTLFNVTFSEPASLPRVPQSGMA